KPAKAPSASRLWFAVSKEKDVRSSCDTSGSRGGGPSPLARARRDRDGAVHGRARHFDRECGVAFDQDRSEFLAGESAVGDHRLLDLLRWVSPAWWEARGSARPPPPVHGGGGPVHRQFAARRACLVGRLADRVPGCAGSRRR